MKSSRHRDLKQYPVRQQSLGCPNQDKRLSSASLHKFLKSIEHSPSRSLGGTLSTARTYAVYTLACLTNTGRTTVLLRLPRPGVVELCRCRLSTNDRVIGTATGSGGAWKHAFISCDLVRVVVAASCRPPGVCFNATVTLSTCRVSVRHRLTRCMCLACSSSIKPRYFWPFKLAFWLQSLHDTLHVLLVTATHTFFRQQTEVGKKFLSCVCSFQKLILSFSSSTDKRGNFECIGKRSSRSRTTTTSDSSHLARPPVANGILFIMRVIIICNPSYFAGARPPSVTRPRRQ